MLCMVNLSKEHQHKRRLSYVEKWSMTICADLSVTLSSNSKIVQALAMEASMA